MGGRGNEELEIENERRRTQEERKGKEEDEAKKRDGRGEEREQRKRERVREREDRGGMERRQRETEREKGLMSVHLVCLACLPAMPAGEQADQCRALSFLLSFVLLSLPSFRRCCFVSLPFPLYRRMSRHVLDLSQLPTPSFIFSLSPVFYLLSGPPPDARSKVASRHEPAHASSSCYHAAYICCCCCCFIFHFCFLGFFFLWLLSYAILSHHGQLVSQSFKDVLLSSIVLLMSFPPPSLLNAITHHTSVSLKRARGDPKRLARPICGFLRDIHCGAYSLLLS